MAKTLARMLTAPTVVYSGAAAAAAALGAHDDHVTAGAAAAVYIFVALARAPRSSIVARVVNRYSRQRTVAALSVRPHLSAQQYLQLVRIVFVEECEQDDQSHSRPETSSSIDPADPR